MTEQEYTEYKNFFTETYNNADGFKLLEFVNIRVLKDGGRPCCFKIYYVLRVQGHGTTRQTYSAKTMDEFLGWKYDHLLEIM